MQQRGAGTDEHPLDVSDPPRIRALGDVLRRHNYTPDGLLAALGEEEGAPFRRVEIPIYLRRLTNAPLHHLIRLFLLGVPVERDALAEALAPLTPADLVALGLAHADGGSLVSPYRLMVFRDLYLVCDRYLVGAALRPDHVTGVNNSSITLATLTVRPSGRALDLGTGCGVQALLASRHCAEVIATDVSPRALNMTLFNAALNGVSNVACRLGSLFEPVQGEQFDLITCNPPYVISPRNDYIFRDAGLRGDAVSRLVVGQAGRYLRPGGYATVLCDWVHAPGDDWAAPLADWVADTGCDAIVLRHHTATPLDYAATWVRQPLPPDETAMARLLDEWLAYYAELGIEAISGGAVILRRSDGPHWLYAESLPRDSTGSAGDHLTRMFAAQDYLRSLPDAAALLDAVLAPTDERLHQALIYEGGTWQVESMRVEMSRGLRFEGPLDELALRLLMAFDGERQLGPLIVQAARETGQEPHDVLGAALDVVRRWLELGLLELAADHVA
ncbi:MAG: class I SAM-dependent methyltransferase [Anaerolineae bacterium]